MMSRVLVVDDSEDDIEMNRRFLAGDTTEIRGVTDSTLAEQVFTEFEPDLILLDLHMPQPDGLEILRRIRDARSRLGFLPVLVLTGDVEPVARNNALDLGADDFLLKPLDRQVILLYLEGEQAASIAEITGLSAVNVATKIHRIKRMLKQKYVEGANDART